MPALIEAVEEAAQRPVGESTEITINGTYRFSGETLFAFIRSDVTLRGGARAAVLTAADGWQPYFNVDRGGSLALVNLEFADFEMNGSLIYNTGSLTLDRVQFTRVQAHPYCIRIGCFRTGRLVENEANSLVLMNQVSVVDSGSSGTFISSPGSILTNSGEAIIRNFQLYLPTGLTETPFFNTGTLRIHNATFGAESYKEGRLLFGDLIDFSTQQVEIGNTIVSGFGGQWCDFVVSKGHNLVDNPDCGFDAESDLTGMEASLIWAPVTANWSSSGKELLTKALVPLADSPAIDSGSPDACLDGSLLGTDRASSDGDGDGLGACDRGAVERVPSTVVQGGINGLYYNPEADGHYLYIADTAKQIMVMWTTFDANGDPAWIFGLANRVRPNGRVLANAYINRDGRVGLDGRLVPAEPERWGTLDVRMQSCNGGKLLFESDKPGFGSGEFRFQRLAVVDQIGCIEGD